MEMVKMVHPALGNRVVDVPDSAVQHLIMSGWKRADDQEAREVIKNLESRLELEKKALNSEPSTVADKETTPSRSTEDKSKSTTSKTSKEEGK